jgi:UDP-glucose 4-epimerase
LAEFRRINVRGSLALASQAVAAGVRRFVFVSSIGVNGAETAARAFHASDVPAPHSPYSQSKLEAENALQELSRRTGLELVIVRPPLVYGPDAPGNFGALLRAVHRGIPLPFGAVHNRRSLVALDNLVDLLARCTVHPAAGSNTFLVSDGEDVSTPSLLRRAAAALGRRAHLLPVPVAVLRSAAALIGKGGMMQSLCASLQVDTSFTREQLGWSPVVTLDQALAGAAQRFLTQLR